MMHAKAALPLAFLLITPFEPSIFQEPCLVNRFLGNYRDGQVSRSIWFPSDISCFESLASRDLVPSASLVETYKVPQQFVWLEEEAVDESLKPNTQFLKNEFDAFFDILSPRRHMSSGHIPDQEVIEGSPQELEYELLYRTPSAVLISVDHDKARMIDTILPRFWKSTLLPTSPVQFQPVSSSSASRVADVLAKLKFDPTVASIVNNISIPQMRNDIRFLTGEDVSSGIISRHSFSKGALTAASWLKDRFESTGATCELKPFLTGFAPNVVCRYPSLVDTKTMVLLSAHYDSRGSFGSMRAPGGDDDGSGVTALLSIARTIAREGIQFHSHVELVAFAGEEQGLLGSKAYSQELRAMNANLTLMIQADMLAYRAPGEPPQLGIPDLIGSPEVAQLVGNVSAIYSPELQVGFTPACCSDHQPFHEQGFPATQVFERAGPIMDPMYHNSGDLSDRDGYDFSQVKSIAKVQFAALLHTAGFELQKY